MGKRTSNLFNFLPTNSGLRIVASQRTMSDQNWVLTGLILGLLGMLSSHFLVQRNFNFKLFGKRQNYETNWSLRNSW